MKFVYTAELTAPDRTSEAVLAALEARFTLRAFDARLDNKYSIVAVINHEGKSKVTHDDIFKSAAALINDALAPHVTIDSAKVDNEEDAPAPIVDDATKLTPEDAG